MQIASSFLRVREIGFSFYLYNQNEDVRADDILLQHVFYNVKCLYRSVRRKWQKNHRSVYEVADE